MNKTSIEWCDFSWNPVTGCKHPCRYVYCYNPKKATAPLNRFGARFKKDGKIMCEKDWRYRETDENLVAQEGEVYPYGYDPTLYPHRFNEPYKTRESSKIFVVDCHYRHSMNPFRCF